MPDIRPAAVAGTFYPAGSAELRDEIGRHLAAAGAAAAAGAPKAIIAPHAGYVYSGPIAAAAYARLVPARGRIARVVLIGPAHYVGFRGLAASSAAAWCTPLGEVPLDRAAIDGLLRAGLVGALDAAHAREHSLEVHVPFLQTVLGRFALVPIVVGEARPEAVEAVLDAVWGGPETLVVVSTDLSHYLDYRAAQRRDTETASTIERFDGASLAGERACGHVGVAGLLRAGRRRGMAIERLDLRNSGDTAGPHDRVVGYGSWALFEGARTDGRSEAEHDTAVASAAPTILALATGAIRAGLATGAGSAWDAAGDLPPLLREKGAAFVTLKRRGALRGCIGSAEAWRPLGEDILDNALKAAFRDPRFPPLVADEVAGLEVKVAVLSPPVPVAAADEAALLAALRPGRDGLIIEDDGKRALFLPSVWTELRDPRQFLLQLKRKAGMADDHWSPRFRARRFHTAEVGTSRDGAPGPDHDAAAMLRPTPA